MEKIILSITAILFSITGLYADDLSAISTNSEEGMDNGEIDLTVEGGAAPFTFSWTGPGGFTSSEEDLLDLVPGVYTVTVTDAWCGVASLEVIVEESVSTVGLSDEETGIQLSIYPNPTNGLINIISDLKTDIVVYNPIGEIVFNQKKVKQIDLSNQPAGVYLLQIKSSKGIIIRKVTLL